MKGHRGANLRKLHIFWWWRAERLKCNEIFRFMWLLNHAVECDVHELDLNFSLEKGVVFVMPFDVFCCESLRSLSIDLHYGAIEFPSPHGFAHLRSLHLSYLKIDDDSFGEKISYVCKFLEKLSLQWLMGIKKFKISIPSLLELAIEDCSFEHLDISTRLLQTLRLNSAPSMNIYAPNLLCIDWMGVLSEYCFVENLSLLQNVHLSLSQDNLSRIKLNSLLPSIVQISHLHINSITIMALYDDSCLPFIFNNLQTLELDLENARLTDSLYQALNSFLQGLPSNLKKLHISSYSSDNIRTSSPDSHSYTYQANYWESQNLRFVQGLEEIDIYLCGGKYEEGLLEYLVENAKQLKKMTISFGPSMSATVVGKLMAVAVARGAQFCFKELEWGDNMMVIELD